jgi:prophage regulatory protein
MNQSRRNKSMNNLQRKLLRLPQVKASTGLSKSTIYARIAEGTFPKQIPLGPRLVVWVESDIQNWIAVQVSAARG